MQRLALECVAKCAQTSRVQMGQSVGRQHQQRLFCGHCSALCARCASNKHHNHAAAAASASAVLSKKGKSHPRQTEKNKKQKKRTKQNSAMQQPQEEERARQREQNAPQTKSMALPLLSSHPHLTTEVIQEQLDINRTLIEVGTRAKQQNLRHDEKKAKKQRHEFVKLGSYLASSSAFFFCFVSLVLDFVSFFFSCCLFHIR